MCTTTKFTAEAWAGNRELAMMFHRRGYGFLKDCDLPELTKIDRLFPCLVRCEGCRFTCAVQDVSHLVGIIEASGQDYVRDIVMVLNPPPPKPAPGTRLIGGMDFGQTRRPEAAAQTLVCSAMATTQNAWDLAEWGAAHPAPYPFTSENGPTGHGEECYSDADPGL